MRNRIESIIKTLVWIFRCLILNNLGFILFIRLRDTGQVKNYDRVTSLGRQEYRLRVYQGWDTTPVHEDKW